MQFKIFTALLILCGCFFASADNSDEIVQLPGLKYKINFRHYSGFLNATKGKYLHYWFVESQNSPSEDPVVLWLNGGPGCSSLEGLLNELGPYHVKPDGKTLYENPYSWNKVANVIFLEAPAGVGYSYSDSKKYDTNDDIVSEDNYLALQHFFKKFPQFRKNDFYITGESYGGIYVPTLSVRVLTGSFDINFKGFAVGNGFLNQQLLGNSIIFFSYYHGLISQSLWNDLTNYCCSGCDDPLKCDFVNSASLDCQTAVYKATSIVSSAHLNVYNLYADCAGSSSVKGSRYLIDKKNMFQVFRFLNKTSLTKGEVVPCVDSSNITYYLNQKSVRRALHIPDFLPPWYMCSDDVSINYRRVYDTMAPQVLQLINSGKLRGLIYNGDVDMACNFLGDHWFADSLGLKVLSSYKPWTFNKQCAGFVKYYTNLTFLTVKGSGHMVPQDKPGPAFKMISSFLRNKPF